MTYLGGAYANRLKRQLLAVRRELESGKAAKMSDSQLAMLELVLVALLELVRLYRRTRG